MHYKYTKILKLVCYKVKGKKCKPLNNKDLISTRKNVVRITIILFIVNTKSSTALKKSQPNERLMKDICYIAKVKLKKEKT